MFKWFKKKNKGMSPEQLVPFREELSAVPKFQWVKTDRAGKVTQFKDVVYQNNMVLVEFTDGSRVNYDMLGDAVMKIEDDSMLLDVQPEEINMSDYQIPVSNAPAPTVKVGTPAPAKSSASPLHALLEKQKSDPVPVEISINLKLPPVSLYKVLSQSFENADEEIVEYIVADLDVPMIREAVREAITNFYSEENG